MFDYQPVRGRVPCRGQEGTLTARMSYVIVSRICGVGCAELVGGGVRAGRGPLRRE